MNKRRVHISIHGTDLEFVYDVDPGFGEVEMLDDAVERAKAVLRKNGTKNAMKAIPGQKPNACIDAEEESPEQQIDRLTSFIAASMQGKANQGEGVVDTVIRVLKEFMYYKYSSLWTAFLSKLRGKPISVKLKGENMLPVESRLVDFDRDHVVIALPLLQSQEGERQSLVPRHMIEHIMGVVEDGPMDEFKKWMHENLGPTPKMISEENYKKALGALRKEALLYREMQKSMSLGPALVCRMLEDIHVEDEKAEL